ncbi:enoyl-CoA hydratase [Bradyrhizobium sp. AUGA SZCCT0042]|uniref:enoyl-CoA hydratase n=1 Tax=Bradyrhizobium sp. AUGA SZCCT0042 TaxID=2807651 RepID=UPI001BAC225F|nr:enoyl-CoA hydratase [Bradyrhizobium sp. AUGA SZCCT0042]MBR1297392.1 enoyl-CoA hydratase [Bradyrhizobium sp. AUGA SZCCT0042]
MSNTLLIKQEGRVVVLTLNRPEKLNALSAEMRKALHYKLLELDKDDGVGAIVLTGAGERAFTAGMDLTEASHRGGEVMAPDENPVVAIEKCRKPIIVAVNGLCITGGMEMMLACDIVIASSTAKFADTHVRIGLMPGWGISQRLARQVGPQRAKEISLSGNFLDARRAFDLGLINRVVEPEELMEAATALALDFADADQRVVEEYKRLIDDGFGMTMTEGLKLERERARAFSASLPADHFQRGKEAAAKRARSRKS